jgi:acetyl-CoA carboxylase alpha subunit
MGEKTGEIRVNSVSRSDIGTSSDKLTDRNEYLREQAFNNKGSQEKEVESRDPKRPNPKLYIKA